MSANPINPFEMSEQILLTLQITFMHQSNHIHRPLRAGVGNLWLASQIWLFWWRHLARLIFS